MAFPKENSGFWTIFLSTPNAPLPKHAQHLFLLSSSRLILALGDVQKRGAYKIPAAGGLKISEK